MIRTRFTALLASRGSTVRAGFQCHFRRGCPETSRRLGRNLALPVVFEVHPRHTKPLVAHETRFMFYKNGIEICVRLCFSVSEVIELMKASSPAQCLFLPTSRSFGETAFDPFGLACAPREKAPPAGAETIPLVAVVGLFTMSHHKATCNW